LQIHLILWEVTLLFCQFFVDLIKNKTKKKLISGGIGVRIQSADNYSGGVATTRLWHWCAADTNCLQKIMIWQ